MTDLISREEAIAIATNRESYARGDTARACRGIAISLSMLPAATAGAIKARALLSVWLETPNEGDPMIDVLMGVIREAHAALEGGE